MTPEMLPFIIFFSLFISNLESEVPAAINESGVVSEWVEVFVQHNDQVGAAGGVIPAYTVYVNSSTIRREVDVVRMWGLVDFANPKTISGTPYMSVKSQDEYDCRARQSRSLSYSFYSRNMAGGQVVVSSASPADWYPVESDAIAKVLLNSACKSK